MATKGPAKCRRKFLRFFPKGFCDEKYIDWERGYKWDAHERWEETLGRAIHRALIEDGGDYSEVARRAVGIESRDLRPRDMIDIQSFLWVQGSDEYEE
ncbi:MAG TPA: hypothetical protein VGQ98_04075 [Gemmatimonadaceae bacterium]|nr:hypothetical protein [Gemmatimonadaceae bacterium]